MEKSTENQIFEQYLTQNTLLIVVYKRGFPEEREKKKNFLNDINAIRHAVEEVIYIGTLFNFPLSNKNEKKIKNTYFCVHFIFITDKFSIDRPRGPRVLLNLMKYYYY